MELNFIFNIITAIIFIIIGLLTKNYIAFIIAVIFISAPFVLYLVSKDIDHHEIALKEDKVDEIKELAERTWKYFEDNLTSENNYLIPDNYQEGRKPVTVARTSSTNIGLSMLAVISSYDLGFGNLKVEEMIIDKWKDDVKFI